MGKGIKFRILYLSAAVIPVLIAVLIISIVSSTEITNQITESEQEKLLAVTSALSEYFAYDIRSNGAVDYDEYSDHAYMNLLVEQNIHQTLFKEDVRFLTSIKDASGKYIEGTNASADIWATVKSGQNYYGKNVDIQGIKYFVVYAPVYADDAQKEVWGMAFAGIPMSSISKVTNSVIRLIIVLSVIILVVLSVIMLLLSKPLVNTLNAITNAVRLIASGNINDTTVVTSVCKEFNEIGTSTFNLQRQLQDTIGGIYRTSEELGETVEKVDMLCNDSAAGAKEITNVVAQLSDTAQSMAESVQDANTAMIDVGASIENITEKAKTVAVKADEMRISNEKSLEDMKKVYSSNEKSVDSISQISAQAAACNEAVDKITDAASTIADIASQTNLLALNASIEAARAGESGRGFAVVAENIRMLAEQSNKSASDISISIQDVVQKVQDCATMAAGAKKLMEEQQALVGDVSGGMENLSNAVTIVYSDIKSVSDETVVLDQAKESVLGSITELSAISEENAASAEEVAATIDSVASGIAGTKEESGGMKGMADELIRKIQFFS